MRGSTPRTAPARQGAHSVASCGRPASTAPRYKWRACMPHTPHAQPGSAAEGVPSPGGVADGAAPVLILDVMDTIVVDPFYKTMPRFFDMTFQELLAAKHPTAWLDFERALITEQEMFASFFKDGRPFDHAALMDAMVAAYEYIDGMPELLGRLQAAGHDMHVCSNYPVWYERIEAKLRLSRYLPWTFVSCAGPMQGLRKPAPAAFQRVAAHLALPPGRCIFVDDRAVNVEAAVAAGMDGVLFQGTTQLEGELEKRGLRF